MKWFACVITVAVVIASPLTTFAQNTKQPVTRAQVKAELVQLENAGYRPSMNDSYYPAKIQAAEAAVQKAKPAPRSYGGAADNTESGSTLAQIGIGAHSIYYGH
jgi:hypothetical protein